MSTGVDGAVPALSSTGVSLLDAPEVSISCGTKLPSMNVHSMSSNALSSLSALLDPEVVEKILDAYWLRNGESPRQFTIDLAARFLSIARETKCVDEAACERLDEMRRNLEDHRRGGLTDKNTDFIRKVLTPGVWSRNSNS